MKLRNKKGFTIIELVIVIAVIGILTAVLVPTFINLTNRANQASDQSLIANLNKEIEMKKAETGNFDPKNPTDVFDFLKTRGYLGETIIYNQKSDKEILWNRDTSRFLFAENRDSADYKTYKNENFWAFSTASENNANGYSVYLFEQFTGSAVNPTAGLDVGENNEITSITLNRASATEAKELTIRSNTAKTALTVNGYVDPADNTKGDVVYHYGSAGSLSVIKCAVGSYHEGGKVAFAEVSAGRVVLEATSAIEHLHINKKANEEAFNTVVIADNGTESLPVAITRDEVQIASDASVPVVTVVSKNGASEVVKVYGDGAKGSTEKTETQNPDVNSLIGQLVLDNGSESKALDSDTKEEVKNDAVIEARSEEVAKEDESKVPANAVMYNVNADTYYSKDNTYANDIDALIGAINAANSKDTLVLLKDVPYHTDGIGLIDISKSLTINGGNHTISGYGKRGSANTTVALNANGGTSFIDVTLKNLNVTNSNSSGRALETRGKITSLILDNCTLSCSGASYPNTPQTITIGGNQAQPVNFVVKNSTVISDAYYAIITFNPVNLTVEDSTIKGWSSIYLKGVSGSAGSKGFVVTAKNSSFISLNKHSGASDTFGAVVIEDGGGEMSFTDCKVDATAYGTAHQYAFLFSTASRKGNIVITIDGNMDDFVGEFCGATAGWGEYITFIINGEEA